MELVLAVAGYRVTSTASGAREAIAKAKLLQPDLQ